MSKDKRSLYDIERAARNSSLTDPSWRTDYRVKLTPRCEARVRRGTGEAFCDRPLNERGECDRAGDHIEEA